MVKWDNKVSIIGWVPARSELPLGAVLERVLDGRRRGIPASGVGITLSLIKGKGEVWMMQALTGKRVGLAATVAFVLLGFARMGYATTTDAQLVNEARQTIALYSKTDPGIDSFVRRSVGYVVFPSVGKGGLGIGGAHGTGILFENGAPVGKVTLNQVTIGAQAGGQEFSQVVFFEVPKTLAELKLGKAQLSGQLSAVALTSGAAANARFKNGVAVFTATKGGLMLEASVGGQKFGYSAF